ncbi:CNNM domain-containing protein, partial [Rhizobium johnstonii]
VADRHAAVDDDGTIGLLAHTLYFDILFVGNVADDFLENILSSSIATSLFLGLFGSSGVALATLAMTVILVILAEVLPKSWAISAPERFA